MPMYDAPLYCECCQREILAFRDGDKIIVRDRRHGVTHQLTIDVVGEAVRSMRVGEVLKQLLSLTTSLASPIS